MPKRSRVLSFTAALAAGICLSLALSSCSTPPTGPGAGGAGTASSTAGALPATHIHGLSVSSTGQVLLAAHEGLYDVTRQPAVKLGPTNDLMGFTGGPDHSVLYASGHPGAGSDMPNPLGLIRSTDGGMTWEHLSRQRESDFHALTVTRSGIVGFDGVLRTSPDGLNWTTVASDLVPAVLAGNPAGDTVLATTPRGIHRSTDGGKTWNPVAAGPVIQFAAFASPTEAVGVEPDGSVHVSADGGLTWTPQGRITGSVEAVAAVIGPEANLSVWAATAAGLVVSNDGGGTFRPVGAS